MANNREDEQQPNRALEQAARSAEQPAGRVPNKPNDQPTVGEAKAGLAAGGQAPDGGEKKRAPFSVAPGKSVTTARGIIEAGAEIKAEDVGGQPNLDRLVEKGAVVKS